MSGDTVERFFGVYLLVCKNPKYLGRTYIGYTVDPNRRIKQHNKGKKAGGAHRTSKRGPWSMVMIIHGFPNDIAALRFEWAWQHPQRSRRLNHLPKKKAREKSFDYCFRIMSEMLRVGPWNRLPLTIRWLDASFVKEFPLDKAPPMFMPIIEGSVISRKVKINSQKEASTSDSFVHDCYVCGKIIEGKKLRCVNPECDLLSHVICLSRSYLQPGQYVPVDGDCPKCRKNFLWGDVIRKFHGCYSDVAPTFTSEAGNDFYSSDSD
ncbi:PREDICTED: structure-specific endonuclease subunit slx1 [Nicrophorus vespilloides]|uniref:Structure-specific endonuclease subunit SLX1 homolog n=1 Tax=Nicrophorus vespilloides TaxID=110193 RepID=A0ABM1MSX3_NICVS|nr:PREDICTED: structure-specific endonuclease subunit slx1 [Nicrophorus vespilloides]